jgi:Cu/Ag efflux pump CusA
LPLVINGNRPGQEIEYPMAVVILGGLATSTLLNLFILPALYLAFGRGGARDRDPHGQAPAEELRPATVGEA